MWLWERAIAPHSKYQTVGCLYEERSPHKKKERSHLGDIPSDAIIVGVAIAPSKETASTFFKYIKLLLITAKC
jgi:hypothetical protein